ncbi:Gfo/Idh/MocA family protein [Pedobacter chitinilyticus]|uniref:Gfo/Idh/MocA family oxidoreductase n=1 Tax=Pedobacter chitinilyticus TaxID=2233776 RepID=A0A443Z0N8_9SPHI|nr:Gfo/Idh/MocA family oxidoreductase [Pedobacter chitinilyticus]RWU10029.1 Gfo/Idh/MocA family oxidoreductase [Pedobacter chitinilyticus]
MNEIKWGIIGCGDVTEVKSGPAFNKVPHSKLVAVMRRDAAKAEDYAKRHGVPKWYSNASDLINDPEVNAIYIATPPLQHEEYTIAALAAGKPVYVEKPMALNGQAAQNMANAAHQYGVKLVVAHYRRSQPLFLKIKSLLAANTIGEVRFVDLKMLQPKASNIIANSEENWRINPAISGGGLFHDLAPHQLDLMLYYFGEVKQFNGLANKKDPTEPVEDLVTGHILFENGVVFNGLWCFSAPQNEQTDLCEIYGSKGKISFSIFGQFIKVNLNGEEESINFEPLPHVEQPMIEQVVAYFRGESENPCSAEEALKTMKLMDGFTSKNN